MQNYFQFFFLSPKKNVYFIFFQKGSPGMGFQSSQVDLYVYLYLYLYLYLYKSEVASQ